MKWVSGLIFTVMVSFSSIAAAENCQEGTMKSLMQELDKAKVESILKLSKEIKAYSKGKEFACVEPLIINFISFYQQSIEEFSKANGIWDLPYPLPGKKRDELNLKIQGVG